MLTILVLATGVAITSNGKPPSVGYSPTKLKVPRGHLYYVCTCPRCPAAFLPRCHPKSTASYGTRANPARLLWPLIVFTALLIAGTTWSLRSSRRRRAPPELTHVVLGPVTPNRIHLFPKGPRQAVLAAVADLEESLSERGHYRAPSELPDAYLRRVLPRGLRSDTAVRLLGRLYDRARYSEQPIAAADAVLAGDAARELSRSAE